jgi:uncharacterized membrane protein YhaH (DUF805 family)
MTDLERSVFKKSLSFSGRAGRVLWWIIQFCAALMLCASALTIVVIYLFQKQSGWDPIFWQTISAAIIIIISNTLLIWMSIAATVQRYHDRGKSGVWFFIGFIPVIGQIWQLIECGFCRGDHGNNNYGPPPEPAVGFFYKQKP